MRFGNRQLTVRNMTFHAPELRVFLPRVNFKIKCAAIIRRGGDMTHIAGRDRYFFRQRVGRVHRRHVVTRRAVHLGVARKLVAERCRRIALAPGEQHNFVFDLHRFGGFRVEIGFRGRHVRFMTGRAVGRRGRDSRICRMTRKTSRVTDGRGFESSLF